MTKDRCCGCNGPMAVCKGCRCAKSKQPCTSCYPCYLSKNKCSNVIHWPNVSNNTPLAASLNNSSVATIPQVDDSISANVRPNISCDDSTIIDDFINFAKIPVLNRVPKGARNQAAAALSAAILSACDSTSPTDWQKLFRFSPICLRKPKRGGKRQPSLTSSVLKNINSYLNDPLVPLETSDREPRHTAEGEDARAKLAGKKIASGDIKGAIRVQSSNDTILPFDDNTLSVIKNKHPSRHSDSNMPEFPSAENVANACLLYTSPSPRDGLLSRMPSSA